jgi:hypothetical protein
MRWIFEGDWTAQDYNQTFVIWKNLASSKPYTVDLLMDMRLVGRMPSNAISLAWQSIQDRPKNVGITIITSDNKLVRTVYQTMTRIYGGHDALIVFASDWEGTLDILQAAQGSRVES